MGFIPPLYNAVSLAVGHSPGSLTGRFEAPIFCLFNHLSWCNKKHNSNTKLANLGEMKIKKKRKEKISYKKKKKNKTKREKNNIERKRVLERN